MKPSGIGGMAVIEGIMMKNKEEYAIAVRKPNNEIVVEKKTHKDLSNRVKLFKLPIFRGIMSFLDSMVIGVKVLNFAASFFEEEEETTNTKNKSKGKNKTKNAKKTDKTDINDSVNEELSATKDDSDKSSTLMMVAAVAVSLVISISLFMVLPVLISGLFAKLTDSIFLLSLMEAILRIVIFIGYILLVSQMPDIKRTFMYHGAEHKAINCIENGFELTVENVRWQSKEHKRCGTSFMLFVMLISAVMFMILQPKTLLLRVVSRILLVPIIAGLSYEFIRWAGKTNNPVVNLLSKPGLWMQGLTTKEPTDEMIEVAIQSVEAVFDWKAFMETAATVEGSPYPVYHGSKTKKEKSGKTPMKNQNSSELEATKIDSPSVSSKVEEEDDEILRALDKYLD